MEKLVVASKTMQSKVPLEVDEQCDWCDGTECVHIKSAHLQPCPWCGGEAGVYQDVEKRTFSIFCSTCKARGSEIPRDKNLFRESRSRANYRQVVDSWNSLERTKKGEGDGVPN